MRVALTEQENLRVGRNRPRLPDATIYAIGDVHGCLDLLNPLLAAIDRDIAENAVAKPMCVFIGDYVDRGLQSRATIDRLIAYENERDCLFIKGNHEQLALNGLRDPVTFEAWLRVGGRETLQSYGVKIGQLNGGRQIPEAQAAFHDALPQSHFNFFRRLRPSFQCGDFFFVHAGIRPEVDLEKQKESDLLWIRDEFLMSERDFGRIVVHGHTPALQIDIRPNRINIDTGAFATGRLSCLVIEGDQVSALQP